MWGTGALGHSCGALWALPPKKKTFKSDEKVLNLTLSLWRTEKFREILSRKIVNIYEYDYDTSHEKLNKPHYLCYSSQAR